MANVTYIEHNGNSHTVDVPEGESIMRGAVGAGIAGIVGECGGGLACATCHCHVDAAWTEKVGGPSTQAERDMLECTASTATPASRLSCQIVMTPALDGLIVRLPETQY